MTVKELIEKLSKFPNKEIRFSYEGEHFPIRNVEIKNYNPEWSQYPGIPVEYIDINMDIK